jgi:hypothetical protein
VQGLGGITMEPLTWVLLVLLAGGSAIAAYIVKPYLSGVAAMHAKIDSVAANLDSLKTEWTEKAGGGGAGKAGRDT